MLDTSILVNATNTKFKSKALADFTQSMADKYGNLIAFIEQNVINIEEEEVTNYFTFRDGLIDGVTDSFITLWDRSIGVHLKGLASFSFGYMTWNDVILSIANDLYKEDEDANVSFPVVDADGIQLSYSNVVDILQAMQMNYHSTVSFNAAVAAVSEVSISERLTVFRDKLASVFQDAYADFSGSTSRYLDLLRLEDNSIALDSLISALSLDQLSQNMNFSCRTLGDTNLGQYTGANPIASYDLSTSKLGDAIVTVGRTTAKVLKGAINALINTGSRLIRKAANIVRVNTSNPADLKVINDSGDAVYSIDQFCWSTQQNAQFYESQLPDTDHLASVLNDLNLDSRRTFKYQLFSGEVIFSFDSFKRGTDENNGRETVTCRNSKIVVKPQILDPALVAAIANTIPGMYCDYDGLSISIGFNSADYDVYPLMASFVSKLNTARPYLDITNENEDQVYLGLRLGTAITVAIIGYGYNQMWNLDPAIWSSDTPFVKVSIASGVTNADFLAAACGYNGTGFMFSDISRDSYHISELDMVRSLIRILVAQKVDQFNNPLDYCFVPYQKGIDTFEPSRFAIKTDQENFDATTKFMDYVIGFAIIAVTALAVGVAIKGISNSIMRKSLARKSLLDNKMWSGQPLTPKELRQYRRASKKIDMLSSLSGNIRSTTGSNENASDSVLNGIDWLNTNITKMIVGE